MEVVSFDNEDFDNEENWEISNSEYERNFTDIKPLYDENDNEMNYCE